MFADFMSYYATHVMWLLLLQMDTGYASHTWKKMGKNTNSTKYLTLGSHTASTSLIDCSARASVSYSGLGTAFMYNASESRCDTLCYKTCPLQDPGLVEQLTANLWIKDLEQGKKHILNLEWFGRGCIMHIIYQGLDVDGFVFIGGRLDSSTIYSDMEFHWAPWFSETCPIDCNPPPNLPLNLYLMAVLLFKDNFIYVFGGKIDFYKTSG